MIFASKQAITAAIAVAFISGVSADGHKDKPPKKDHQVSEGSTPGFVKYTFEDYSELEVGYLPDEQLVKFEVTVKANQWFSIGFGPTMYDTDMVLW